MLSVDYTRNKMNKIIYCPKCKQRVFTVSVQSPEVIRLVCEDATCECRFEKNIVTGEIKILKDEWWDGLLK